MTGEAHAITQGFPNLTAYVDRMMDDYYPEFAWTPLRQAA